MVQSLARSGRTNRRPTHTFNIRHKPFEIAPFMLAPVLPGETLRNLLLQSRVVTDPVANPLIGWHTEYYFFYVKLRALANWPEIQKMLLADSYTLPNQMLDRATYKGSNQHFNFVKEARDAAVQAYFHAEGEIPPADAVMTYDGSARHRAKVTNTSWMQSIAEAFANDPQLDDPAITVGVDDKITGSEIQAALTGHAEDQLYANLRYDEWIAMYGVNVPQIREEKAYPELIRYIREWSYPTNTVDPSTGTPSSALSWAITERADKDRFFNEPGFILGLAVTRPKVYLKNQSSTANVLLRNRYAWLPPEGRWGEFYQAFNLGDGPLRVGPASPDYTVCDVGDLFLYGEQFVNYDQNTATGVNQVSLPVLSGNDWNKWYCSDADITALFKTAGKEFVRQDGIVQLTVATHLRDQTPESIPDNA